MRRAHQKHICIHASSVKVAGKALLFLGYSTSGKTTISRLLSERYPVIADDRVWVFKKKNSWLMQNGSRRIHIIKRKNILAANNEKYPLFAIIRIFKSKTSGIYPLSAEANCRYLMDAIFEIDYQRKQKDLEIKKKWFFNAADISRNIGGWHLTFKNDRGIIKIIHDTFENMS